VQVGEEKLATSPDKKGLVLSTQEEAQVHVDRLWNARYRVEEVRQREIKRTPAPPFTTSTLQQEAARKLGFSSRKTMQIAQRLYEGVNLPGEGHVGLITYMRTDSVNIAEQALGELAQLVTELYGPEYALAEPRRYRKKQRGAQEAHEAIRPTGAHRLPDEMDRILDRDQGRLYRLIWQRTVASQMAEARFDQVSVDVSARPEDATAPVYLLRATGQTLKFDGFRRVYFEWRDDTSDEDAESMLPGLTAEQALRLLELLPEQHFTQPPPRFTEASLVKALEENGIGRPSTYAPTISTLLDRKYVRLEDKRFYPEDIGEVVVDTLVDYFPEIVDVGFTSRLEEELDDVAEGKAGWVSVLREFYDPFKAQVDLVGPKIQPPEKILAELCPRCPEEGRDPPGHLVEKLGRYGKFIACENYPECKYTAGGLRRRAARARAARRDVSRMRPAAPAADRAVRTVRGLQRLPGVQVHQEGATEGYRRPLPGMQAGRTGRTPGPLRQLLLLQPVPSVRVRREPAAVPRALSQLRRLGGGGPGRGPAVHRLQACVGRGRERAPRRGSPEAHPEAPGREPQACRFEVRQREGPRRDPRPIGGRVGRETVEVAQGQLTVSPPRSVPIPGSH